MRLLFSFWAKFTSKNCLSNKIPKLMHIRNNSACFSLICHQISWWRGWTKNKSWRLYKHHAWFFQTCVDFGILLQSLFICLHFVDRCQNNNTGLYQLFRSVFLAAISNSRNKQWITFHSYRSFTLEAYSNFGRSKIIWIENRGRDL